MTETKVIEVVSACVVKDGRALLVKRTPGKSHACKWVTPGGKVEPGESHHAATVRECKEECGLDIREEEIGAIVYAHDLPSTTRPGELCRVTCRRVEWRPDMGDVRLRLDEVDGFGWFTPEEILAMASVGWLGPADAANVAALAPSAALIPMKLEPADAAVLARIIDDRSSDEPREWALLDRLYLFLLGRGIDAPWSTPDGYPPRYYLEDAVRTTHGSIELSPEEAELAAACVEAAIPDWAKERARLATKLRASGIRRRNASPG